MGFAVRICVGWLALASVGLPAPTVNSLHAYRFGGTYYVAVSEVAGYYNLGSDTLGLMERAEYRTATAQLVVEAERRDILVNGVTHWISSPILATRGRLWISELDVLKTLDPVLRPERLRSRWQVRTVVLDPGHGGTDRGTRGRSSLEKTLTLDVAKRVERILEASGVNVVLTRTYDRTVPLDDRVSFARAQKADLFVSIHFNSGGFAEGIETYCVPPAGARSTASPFWSRDERTAMPSNRFDDQSVWLAHCVQKALLRATGAVDRGVRRARFYVLRYQDGPAILVEAGFLSSPADPPRIGHALHCQSYPNQTLGTVKYLHADLAVLI